MSNYNSQLQSNNTDLQAILNTINELPEAGVGEIVLQDKTVTPTTNTQNITADNGYDGLDTVTVEAMPVTTQATPSISVDSSGEITATATQSEGYVSAGTKSATHQLAFQAAKTITPTTASQVAVASGYYTGGDITVSAVPTQTKSATPTSTAQSITPDSGKFLSEVTVGAIPSTYVEPTATKGETTYTPTTTAQTIASGTYLTGTQTIQGDSNLVASNIKSGVSIFGVSGVLGGGEEYDSGYDAGQKAEYDRFWDAYQENGKRTNYSRAFAGAGWTNETFQPKYDIKSGTAAASLFEGTKISGDLAAMLEQMGIALDLSKATDLGSAFSVAYGITRLPVLDFTNASRTLSNTFYASGNIKKIDKIICSEATSSMTTSFAGANSLEEVTFEGIIAKDIKVSWCPLTYGSLMSIINCLKDYSGSGTTYTCTLGATNLEKLTDAEKAIATEKGWSLA